MYLCAFCGYSSDKKNNFLRHLKTDRHHEIFSKKIDDNEKGYYHCIFCKFKNKKKSTYLNHINLCMMKNLNKSIQIDSKNHISQIQSKFKSEIRSLNSQIKNESKKNILCLKIIGNLIKEDYISERILNDKNVWSLNEKKKIFTYLHQIMKDTDKNNTNEKDVILKNIENQADENITTIYLNNINKNKIIDESETNVINNDHSESDRDYSSDSESDSDYDSSDDIMNGLKKIRDCGRIYYYDDNNVVYNNENNRIGKRVHDDTCPRCQQQSNYSNKCWWYVEYD